MFNNQNPGLRRRSFLTKYHMLVATIQSYYHNRFPLESAFHFEDFKLSELMEIFKALCQQEGIGYTLSALKEVENVLDNQKCSSLAGCASYTCACYCAHLLGLKVLGTQEP
ncbi:hypothetical protein Zmor_027094 [Zophobas morio]|uniref:Uncharacterized protein n=1 Tax=Zophobas morio TaxID=2755281 RepID=A0AA38HJ97_9CUCU|nr:hypothetical protein Zmor_027094 [Zophobas morio]